MIRLCIDARMYSSSGIGTFLRNLIPYLSQPPFELTLLTDGQASGGKNHILFKAPIYSIQEQLYFPWKVPPCDLFWSPHYNAPISPIRSRYRAVTIHDVCHLALPLSRAKRSVAKILLKNACRKSDQIITDSNFSKSEMVHHLKCFEKDVEVIYPGVDTEEFSPQKKEKYPLPSPFFLFVGNFKIHKNLSTLVKAFERLGPSDCHLALVGKYSGLQSSDSETFELIQKSPFRQRIHLLGEVSKSDLPLLYASAKGFIFPSLYEGFGLPPLEAMASGCPVLASTAASIPEVCSDAVLYFSPHSIEELASQMELILKEKNPCSRLIEKGLVRCREFSWKRTGDNYRNLFEKICK